MAAKDTNIIGLKFCRLTIQEEVERKIGGRQIIALCDCGVVKQYYLGALTGKRTMSCGCLNLEAKKSRVIHSNAVGKKLSGAYTSWAAMKQRCLDENSIAYQFYGARGILVCDSWMSFEGFLADMGSRPPKHSIDRIDPNGNYEPSNCKWATMKEQANNTRQNRVLEHDGKCLTVSQWSDATGIEESLIRKRIDNLHWTVARALTTTADARFRSRPI